MVDAPAFLRYGAGGHWCTPRRPAARHVNFYLSDANGRRRHRPCRLEVSFRRPRQELPNDAPVEAGFVSFPVKTLPTTLVVPEGVATAGDFTDYFPRRDGPPLDPPYADYGGLSATFSLILVTPRGTPSTERATSGEARQSSCRKQARRHHACPDRVHPPPAARHEPHRVVLGHGARQGPRQPSGRPPPVVQPWRASKHPPHLVLLRRFSMRYSGTAAVTARVADAGTRCGPLRAA